MTFGVLSFKLPAVKNFPSLLEALPQLGVNGNVMQSLQGTFGRGLGAIIFQNGDSMLRSFGGFAEGPQAAFPKFFKDLNSSKSAAETVQLPGQGKGLHGGIIPPGF